MRTSSAFLTCALATAAFAPTTGHSGVLLTSCPTKGANCVAPTVTVINTPGGKRHKDEFFVGINWNFVTKGSELVVGARSLRTYSNKHISGVKLDMIIPLTGVWTIDRVRAAYVNGKARALGELGFGYSFSQKTGLVLGALQVPHGVFGLDYLFTDTALPYVGLNSLKKPRVGTTSSSELGCSTGTLTPVSSLSGFNVDAGAIVDGQTCFNNFSNVVTDE